MTAQKQPTGELDDIIRQLARPFTPDAVQFRVVDGGSGERRMVAAFIDARTVQHRLDTVVPLGWSFEMVASPVPGALECRMTLRGVTRSDAVMFKTGSHARFDTAKATYSDALKRCAVQFGVGRSLYALPKMWAKVRASGNSVFILPEEEKRLRNEYRAWLASKAGKEWGEPLGHEGLSPDAIGELADEEAESAVAGATAEAEATVEEMVVRIQAAASVAELDSIAALIAHRDEEVKQALRPFWAARLAELQARAKGSEEEIAPETSANPVAPTKPAGPTQSAAPRQQRRDLAARIINATSTEERTALVPGGSDSTAA